MTWFEEAACHLKDNQIFFPVGGGKTKEARAICATCPVEAQCLAYALEHQIWYGVWGGTSGDERRVLAGLKPAFTHTDHPRPGPGRPRLRPDECLFPYADCGTSAAYQRGCGGEHCLARIREISAEKRRRRKERQAHEHDLSSHSSAGTT